MSTTQLSLATRFSNRRGLRVLPPWLVSAGVHGTLALVLLLGLDRRGIPDGSGRGNDLRSMQVDATFTTLNPTGGSGTESGLDIQTDPKEGLEQAADAAPPVQPDSADIETPPAPDPVVPEQPTQVASAVPSRQPQATVEEGPAIAEPAPENRPSHSNRPPASRLNGAAAHYASLLPSRGPRTGIAGSDNGGTTGDGDDARFGDPNGTSFFQIRAQGQHFCYVVDCSSSMEEADAIGMARTELNASLRRLDPRKRFQILFYDSELHPLVDGSNQIFPATPSNRMLARQFMSGQQPNNRALHRPALLAALKSNPDVIFLLTDGELPELSARDLYDLKQANRRRTQINVVEFGKGAKLGSNWLEQLARDHRGDYRYEDISATE